MNLKIIKADFSKSKIGMIGLLILLFFMFSLVPICQIYNPGKHGMQDIGAWEVLRISNNLEFSLLYLIFFISTVGTQLSKARILLNVSIIISLLSSLIFAIIGYYMLVLPIQDLIPYDSSVVLFLFFLVASIFIYLNWKLEK